MDQPSRTAGKSDTTPFDGTVLEPLARAFAIDFRGPERQPNLLLVAVATVVSLAGSLVADALIAVLFTKVFPHLSDYPHFQFADYAKLTVIGVVVACVAWPVTTRLTSRPRWLFRIMAVVVTVVLLAPDAYLLVIGSSPTAVLGLVIMHLAIALVTYNALVRIAPAGPDRSR
jgi:hypothetical protein